MNLSRREFLFTSGIAVTGPTVSSAFASQHDSASEDAVGVLVDIPNCVGCRKCEYACQEAAGFEVPPIEAFEDKSVFTQERRPYPRSYTVVNEYANPNDAAKPIYAKVNCLHCLEPACVSACLVGALRKQPNGPVTYDASRCMGCRYCMIACPFECPTYEYTNPLTPQVRKCTLCADRLAKKGGVPACVEICPRECLIFGKRTDLLVRAHEMIRERPDQYINHVYGEHEVGGTSWLYLSGVPFEQLDFLKLGSVAPSHRTEAIQHGIFKFFVPPLALYGLLGIIMHLNNETQQVDAAPAHHSSSSHEPSALGAELDSNGPEQPVADTTSALVGDTQ